MSTPNNNPKGIVLILLGMAFFSIQDSLIKFINEDTSLYEIYFGRTLIAFILLLIYLKVSSQKLTLKTHYPLLTITRVICFFFGFSFFYISLTFMTLAMANALFFSSPFFVSILAVIFLKEKVGIRRWLGIAVGFLGVYIVLDPNFEDFNYMKLAPVACSLCYAVSMTITKYTSSKDNVYTQMTHLYIGALIISTLFFIFVGEGQFNSIHFQIQRINLFLENGSLIQAMHGHLLLEWDLLVQFLSIVFFQLILLRLLLSFPYLNIR